MGMVTQPDHSLHGAITLANLFQASAKEMFKIPPKKDANSEAWRELMCAGMHTHTGTHRCTHPTAGDSRAELC